jgi:hypothetical protein
MFRRVLFLFNASVLWYYYAGVSMFLDEFLIITYSQVVFRVV